LHEDGIQQYQSLISSMQWAISIGCFGIAVHVMSMSSFRTSPQCTWTPWPSQMHDRLSCQL
jgi:hypothetical protein